MTAPCSASPLNARRREHLTSSTNENGGGTYTLGEPPHSLAEPNDWTAGSAARSTSSSARDVSAKVAGTRSRARPGRRAAAQHDEHIDDRRAKQRIAVPRRRPWLHPFRGPGDQRAHASWLAYSRFVSIWKRKKPRRRDGCSALSLKIIVHKAAALLPSPSATFTRHRS